MAYSHHTAVCSSWLNKLPGAGVSSSESSEKDPQDPRQSASWGSKYRRAHRRPSWYTERQPIGYCHITAVQRACHRQDRPYRAIYIKVGRSISCGAPARARAHRVRRRQKAPGSRLSGGNRNRRFGLKHPARPYKTPYKPNLLREARRALHPIDSPGCAKTGFGRTAAA